MAEAISDMLKYNIVKWIRFCGFVHLKNNSTTLIKAFLYFYTKDTKPQSKLIN